MGEILTQDEINALLAAIAEEGESGGGGEEAGEPAASGDRGLGRRVRPYDFGRPNKLSKDQLRTLQIMHESFARGIATSLSGYLRTYVEVEVVSADAMLYEEFSRRVPNPGILAIFALPPLEGNIVVEVNPAIGFAIIDRLLGGPGTGIKRIRELTELEQPVMRRIIERIMSNLGSAWSHLINIDPKFEQLELNPQFAQLAPPKDMVVVISLVLSMRGASGRINLCIPYDVIEPVVPKLSAHYLFSTAKKAAVSEHSDAIGARLMTASVPLRVVLGRASVSLKELLDLQVGDYVPLETKKNSLLPVLVGSKPKFLARPGRLGSHLAVEVVCPVTHEEVPLEDE